ncbi:MAG: flagellar biosynthesis protein FlhF [Thermotogae bacterium]|nr:flagellar biosynthesis protein FlhF [Thermotogota bacterium]
MKFKKYVVKDMKEALINVKHDLGDNAVILYTRYVRKGGFMGLFGKKYLEVAATVDDRKNESSNLIQKPELKTNTERKIGIYDLQQIVSKKKQDKPKIDVNNDVYVKSEKDNEGLRKELNDIKRMLTEVKSRIYAKPIDENMLIGKIKDVRNRMIEQEVKEEVVEKITDRISLTSDPSELSDLEILNKKALDYLSAFFKVTGPTTLKENSPTIAIFVGATGVGKTTTIAKLAADYYLHRKKKVGIVTIDTYRIAAVDQLKTYSNILGVPMNVAYTPKELEESLEAMRGEDLILIDTAGRSQRNSMHMSELRVYVDICRPDEIYLLLSATTKYTDIKDMIKQFSTLGECKLIFTKLDETTTFGNILNAIYEFDKSLAYVTMGQNVPDDIEVAEVNKLSHLIIYGPKGYMGAK